MSRLRTVSLKYHVSHTGYSSAVCGAVQHSVVWLSNAMRSLVGLCIARHGSAPRRGLAPSGIESVSCCNRLRFYILLKNSKRNQNPF